jgi:hypothetical protein
MPANLFGRRAAGPHPFEPPVTPDPAFAARPRLVHLRGALRRAARRLRPSRWNEPAVFFFDTRRQAELEAARPAPPDPFAGLSELVASEMPGLLASVEVRRVARAVEGLSAAARAFAPHCRAAKELADLLAVPDDETFLALAPAGRAGVRLHVRGAADMAQLYELLAPSLTGATASAEARFQLFTPAALRSEGSLPAGFAGCEQWLWPTQPLAAVPRIDGERVVLVGPAVVRASLEVEPRFPALVVESSVLETLNAFQTAERLSRLAGRTVSPVAPPEDAAAVARAA